MPLVKIDDIEYNSEDLSDEGNAQLQSIKFIDRQLLVLQNEIAAFKTARVGYLAALRSELSDSNSEQKNKKTKKKKK